MCISKTVQSLRSWKNNGSWEGDWMNHHHTKVELRILKSTGKTTLGN